MKNLTLLLAFVFAVAGTVQAQDIASSKMWIEGTSTVKSWTCDVTSLTGVVNLNGGDVASVSQATIIVPVSQIDCDNRQMNGKVRDALSGSPGISFTLDSAVPNGTHDGWQGLTLRGQLEMNGTQRPYQFDVEGRSNGNGTIVYRGQAPLNMTDFGVKPPTAMLGTLRAGEEVVVHFEMTLNS